RLYGKGKAVLRDTDEWEEFAPHFIIHPSTRQIIVADIHLVQTSCGYGVPFYTYVGERRTHFDWAGKKGEEGLHDYIMEKNVKSLDGLETFHTPH
ncbi:MAG: pyridoxamine 5'-phosphate oxidase family protein, partial [Flavobacteriales bacterium]